MTLRKISKVEIYRDDQLLWTMKVWDDNKPKAEILDTIPLSSKMLRELIKVVGIPEQHV
jgi:hypothetical protein